MDVWTMTIRDARRCTMIEGLEHLVSIRIAHHYSDTSHRKVRNSVRAGQPHPAEARLLARYVGEGNASCPLAGRGSYQGDGICEIKLRRLRTRP